MSKPSEKIYTEEIEARIVEKLRALPKVEKKVKSLTELTASLADVIRAARANGHTFEEIAKLIMKESEAVEPAEKPAPVDEATKKLAYTIKRAVAIRAENPATRTKKKPTAKAKGSGAQGAGVAAQ